PSPGQQGCCQPPPPLMPAGLPSKAGACPAKPTDPARYREPPPRDTPHTLHRTPRPSLPQAPPPSGVRRQPGRWGGRRKGLQPPKPGKTGPLGAQRPLVPGQGTGANTDCRGGTQSPPAEPPAPTPPSHPGRPPGPAQPRAPTASGVASPHGPPNTPRSGGEESPSAAAQSPAPPQGSPEPLCPPPGSLPRWPRAPSAFPPPGPPGAASARLSSASPR
uniref:Uncharacterized protein n=1 Tax=Pelodiscus sinensis TaxID=13735 RepID=K7G250_PELSI